jgi:histidine decarboxylase
MAIDSISASGHKMVGTPMPCGVLVARRPHVDRVASAVSYLRSNDTTLMGSRNGHAVLAIWNRVTNHGVAGFTADVAGCLARTERVVAELEAMKVPVLRNPLSLTVVFPAPSEAIVSRYQLACHRGQAHAVIMPNVGDDLIDRFLDDYSSWWRGVSPLGEIAQLARVGS